MLQCIAKRSKRARTSLALRLSYSTTASSSEAAEPRISGFLYDAWVMVPRDAFDRRTRLDNSRRETPDGKYTGKLDPLTCKEGKDWAASRTIAICPLRPIIVPVGDVAIFRTTIDLRGKLSRLQLDGGPPF